MFKRIFALILAVAMFSTLAVGCQPAKKPAPDRTVPKTAPKTAPKKDRTPGTAPMPTTSAELDRIAKKLAKEATKVKGVRKATVVISNTTAYVGIDLQPKFERKQTEAVKESVADRVENADKRITRVYVTSDVGLVTRIRRIADGIADGRPLSSFANEIREIGDRIVPDSSRE